MTTIVPAGAVTKMARPASILAACLLTASSLAVGSAQAQTGFVVDRLISGSAEIAPLRGINPDIPAAKRYAIVIGNSDYAAIPDLPNAHADADVMAQFFKAQGYLVHQHEDITKRGFEDVLRRVLFDVDRDTEVVVFFAGHGFQIGSENYLVPTDADLDSIYDVPFEAVSLGSLVGIIGARARLQVVILDSCRDNPFAGKEVLTQVGNTLRETRTGFSSQAAPLNSMLVYSTAPGTVAFDGDGDNSPFTASLVEEASSKPDALIKDVVEGVRRLTFERTNGRQVPWDSSTLIEPATFGQGVLLTRPIPVSSTGTGETRGLARVAEAAPEGSEEIVNAAMTTATIEVDFVPEVEIGPALLSALDLAPDAKVTFTARPETGILMREVAPGIRRDVTGEEMTPDEIFDLLLINQSVQIPALSLQTKNILDAVTLTVDGVEQQIVLNLIPNDCDFEAGDHLDPDGMGITRYPNEIRPDIALAACQAAVAASPETGRFHYQLGRAYEALRQNDQAKASYERARELENTRSWYALAQLARQEEIAELGGRSPYSENVRQLMARGVSEGDPYAFHSLGYELLSNGGSTEVEVEGYDLLVRAMEVGHTFSMNALTGIYLNEESDYFDPERALRYMRESVSRNDIYGFYNLARAYQRGQAGLEVDLEQAFALMQQAAEGGHPRGPYRLGQMYAEGIAPGGVDLTKAIPAFEESLNRGDAFAAANAAFYLLSEDVPGYDAFDAMAIAAKGAALVNRRGADAAMEQLQGQSASRLDGGTQRIMVEMGLELEVDGAFGPASQSVLNELLAEHGAGPAKTDPLERLLQIAALHWKLSPFRTDLL